jgi:DtxR family Mn-dependent transcriptional regulator
MAHKPSSIIEDYLMEIYDMMRAERPVIAARLTEKMGVTAPTVWNTVHRMQRDGLVDIDASKEITLAPPGLEAAESISAAPATERLLVDLLGLTGRTRTKRHTDRAHDHAARRSANHGGAGNPTTCPHGNPFPG